MLLNKWKAIVTDHTRMFSMYLMVICYLISFINCETVVEEYDVNNSLYLIEGKVYAPEIYTANDFNWQRDTVITINNGEYNGYLKEDGTFTISGVPSGSYVVEVSNPDYYYESVCAHSHNQVYAFLSHFDFILICILLSSLQVRVEINPKGKFRARKLNYVQPSQVVQIPYPLKLKAITRFKYFQTREQWKVCTFTHTHTHSHMHIDRENSHANEKKTLDFIRAILFTFIASP